jgi:kumamolisin
LAVAVALVSVFYGMIASGPLPAAAASPSPSALTPLESSAAPNLEQADRIGQEDDARQLDIQLALKPRQPLELEELIRRVSTPGSPEYGQYLRPDEFARRFGPTAEQVRAAAGYLRDNGFEVTGATSGSRLVNARASAGTIAQAMGTRIGRYRDRETGREFHANESAPLVPATLASTVVGVLGLDNRYQRHHAAAPCAGCVNPPYLPDHVRTGYGLKAGPLASFSGTGQTLGLIEFDIYNQANITYWDTNYSGFTTFGTVTPLLVDGGPRPIDHSRGGQIEAEMDIEIMQGYAHDANILVFEAPNTNTGANDAYSCMVNPNYTTATGPCPNQVSGARPSVISTSWGLCEPDQGVTETMALNGIFQQAAAQGQSVFAASGDSGAYDCRNARGPSDSRIAVDSPASDPYVTGTGGTRLLLDATTNAWRAPEAGWTPYSGGGLSWVFDRPSWQAGPGVLNASSNGKRQVPDVALNGDPVTGYRVYSCATPDPSPCTPANGAGPMMVGGTSAAAPAWAAFTALYNQYAASVSKPVMGYANPALYGAANCPRGFQPFHDATIGNNYIYSATPGWDYVTGWGSFNAPDLAQALAGASPATIGVSSVGQGSGTIGDVVTITGCGFKQDGAAPPGVSFGGVASPKVTWQSAGSLQATVPRHVPGAVTVTVTNGPGAGGGSSSPPGSFNYVPSGYTLDGYGGVHSYGASRPVPDSSHAYWGGWEIARGVATCPENNHRGYTLDGWGGIHPFGDATLPAAGASAYWSGWDIARALVLTSCSPKVSGYVLDGWGGLHEFGTLPPPPVGNGTYWPGWDIARAIAVCPDASGGYTMDAYGGVHPWGGGLPQIGDNTHAYWAGWSIARGLVLTKCSGGDVRGYTLDGWGGVHAFSSCRCLRDPSFSAYWSGWDIARAIQVSSDGGGGYVLDGWGGLHEWGTAQPAGAPSAYWPRWDIARAIGSSS